MISLKLSSIQHKNPYDTIPDSQTVGKAMIFDQDNKVLLLQRSDEGNYWDLPGGHLKQVEVDRGEHGLDDGLGREVAEETGLLLPFEKRIGRYNFVWEDKDHDIHIYVSKLDQKEPEVDLTMQDFQENIDYVWVSIAELQEFLPKSTKIITKALEFLPKGELFEQDEPFQRAMKKKHFKMKRRLIGLGNNKSSGGGKGHKKPSFKRSKSAPPLGEAHEPMKEAQDEPKKRTIKVKITPKLDEKRKKRKKKKKKTRKRRKYAYHGGYIPYDFGSSDGGGDGGGGE
jgi:ADP-ribose pyrophosphatase YjhB (NUDIX family)